MSSSIEGLHFAVNCESCWVNYYLSVEQLSVGVLTPLHIASRVEAAVVGDYLSVGQAFNLCGSPCYEPYLMPVCPSTCVHKETVIGELCSIRIPEVPAVIDASLHAGTDKGLCAGGRIDVSKR